MSAYHICPKCTRRPERTPMPQSNPNDVPTHRGPDRICRAKKIGCSKIGGVAIVQVLRWQ